MSKGKEMVQKWEGGRAEEQSPTTDDEQLNDNSVHLNTDPLGAEPQVSSRPISSDRQIGHELATIFKDNNIHPVLIFGSKGAGKSTLLTSLFGYILKSGASSAKVSLRDDIFPGEDPRWSTQIAWARDFFYKRVFDFIERKAPRATQESSPFFIPIKLTRTNGQEINFAFLEGKGEWYMHKPNEEMPFQSFHELLQGMLGQFNAPATVIYVAPFTTGSHARNGAVESANSDPLRLSDLGLLGSLNEYVSLRRAVLHRDNQMFLMTKWDVFCGGLAGESFISPSPEELEQAIASRFELSWAGYQNLGLDAANHNKLFSAYCSGVIDHENVLKPASEDLQAIEMYQRKIWNWLHTNAVGTPLYPDMLPKKESLLDRFIRIIRG